MTIVYDQAFNSNEWFIIISLMISIAIIVKLPRMFHPLESILYFSIGIYIGTFFDHTLGAGAWDFYDVNDTSNFQLIDAVSYIMYGPYSYLFMYFYVYFGIKGWKNLLYVLVWSTIGVGTEWISHLLNVFHYEKGYEFYWSFPIYYFVQTLQVLFYHTIQYKKKASPM